MIKLKLEKVLSNELRGDAYILSDDIIKQISSDGEEPENLIKPHFSRHILAI